MSELPRFIMWEKVYELHKREGILMGAALERIFYDEMRNFLVDHRKRGHRAYVDWLLNKLTARQSARAGAE